MTFLRWLALCTAALCIQGSAAAQSGPAGAFSFLRLEPSARASALAGSFSAVYGEDINALFYNPALVNQDMHRALSVSYLNHLGGINAGFIAYGRHVDGIGTFGAGLRFVSWGDMNGYDETGTETGGIGASDAALTVSFARSDDSRLLYGASVHAILSSVGSYGASAIAGDAGIAYHL
ncbi:MAG: PorV/PorQ family protein, partial [Rhodothermales bacterium]